MPVGQDRTDGLNRGGCHVRRRIAIPVFGSGKCGVVLFPCGIGVDGRKEKEREAYYQTETAKKLAESPGAGANAAVELLREQERIGLRRKREGVKLGGLITAAVGIGVMVMLRGLEHNEPAYLAGVVPLLIGVAMLTYGYVLAPKE